MRKFAVAIMATFILLALAVPAFAHVTIQPGSATTGAFARFDFRVPNERDAADTVKIEVDFPDNITNVSFKPKAGWERTVTMKTLDEPLVVFGREVTEVVDTVTWEGGTIAPGEFDEFGFTIRTPDDAGTLVFPAVQTYSDGEEVAWIGAMDADEPAPHVDVAAGGEEPAPTASDDSEPGSEPAAEATDNATTGATAGATDDAEDDGVDDDNASTRANIALVLGALGLLVGIGAAVMAGRRT